MNIILYTTGCPRCKALKQALDECKIEYTECTNISTMQELGIESVPVLSVDSNLIGYNEAVTWVMHYAELRSCCNEE